MKLIFSLIVLSILSNGVAQDAKTLLWGIVKPGSTDTSYVFGTIHMLPKKEFTIEPKVKKAFNKSSVLVMEVDLDMDLKLQMEMAHKMVIPNGQTLKDYMSPEEFVVLKSYCIDSLKISEKKFERYIHIKPFFLTALLMKDEYGDIKSFEQEFDKLAKKQKKNVKGLESIQFQIGLTDSISMKDQIAMMKEGLYSEGKNEFYEMVKLYQQEDFQALYSMIVSDTKDYSNFNQLFLADRNQKWIPVINELVANQKVFIAVGAGHLGGDSGVIQLLKNSGYHVFPILD